MSLPSSITLNVGSPAADVVFTNQVRTQSEVAYSAASPQNDLEGRPTLRIVGTTRKTGIVSHLIQFKIPYWNSNKSSYDGYVTAQVTLARSSHHPVQLSLDALELMREALTNNSAEISLSVANAAL